MLTFCISITSIGGCLNLNVVSLGLLLVVLVVLWLGRLDVIHSDISAVSSVSSSGAMATVLAVSVQGDTVKNQADDE